MSELKTPPIAARLRASVLQQAIQGRLVPQDPADESASALLERIRKQRAELVRQKKAKAPKGGESRIFQGADGSWYEKKGKSDPVCIDEEIPFDIPESWEWTRMSTLIELLSGVDLESSQYNDKHEGIPYITGASNFNNGSLIENRWTSVPKRISHKGDLLFTCKGTVGDMAVNSFEEAHIARQVMAVCPVDYEMLSYIEIVLSAQVERIKNAAKGVIPGIERKTILDGLVSLPSIEEQRRIVDRINEIMPLIDQLEIKERESDSVDTTFWRMLPQSILQQAVEGKLVPQDADDEPACALLERIREERAELVKQKKAKAPKGGESRIYQGADGSWYEQRGKTASVCIDEEIPFDIPESWEWARLENVSNYIQRGKSPKYSNEKRYPVVAQKCNQWSGFSLEKAKFIDPASLSQYGPERFLVTGDLLWNSTGLGTLGRMAIYDAALNSYECAVADSHVTVIRTDSHWMNYSFLFKYFAGPSVQRVIESKASGSTKQKELALATVQKYLVPVPPLAEQQRIVAKVDEVLGLLNLWAA